MKFFQQRVFSVLMLTIVGMISACNAAPTQSPPADVSVQLAWVDTIEYAGFYMAQENELYKAENINLDIKPYEIGVSNPLEAVVAGEATFGIMGADKVLPAREAGEPIVAIATIYQRSPIAFISLQENNISTPEALVGKKVMVTPQGTTDVVFLAMLDNVGIPVEDVEIVPRTDFSNDALLNGDVDVMDAFITNQRVQLEAEGYELDSLLVADYGIEMYANVIFTTEDMIANQPDVILRFLRDRLGSLQRLYAVLAHAPFPA
jgi:NitT/TauT family transport system substrate-binding protein